MDVPQPSQTRRACLKALLDKFTLQDQKELVRGLKSVTLQCDIVGKLPPELAQKILLLLDPDDLVFFRLVSKQWLTILSDDKFCQALCRIWFDNSKSITGPNGSPLTTNEKFLRHASTRHALMYGRPWAMARYEGPFEGSIKLVSYCDGRLAWYEDGIISDINLETGRKATYRNETRAKIIDLRISRHWLVGLEGKQCWALNLHSRKTTTLPIPSANYRIWDVFEDTVILHCPPDCYGTNQSGTFERDDEAKLIHIQNIVWNPQLNHSYTPSVQWLESTKDVAFTSSSRDSNELVVIFQTDTHVWLGKLQKDGTIVREECLKILEEGLSGFEERVSASDTHPVDEINRLPKLAKKALYSGPRFYQTDDYIIDDRAQSHKSNIQGAFSWLKHSPDGPLQVADDVMYVLPIFKYDDGPFVYRVVDGYNIMDAEDICLETGEQSDEDASFPSVGLDNSSSLTYPEEQIILWIDADMIVLARVGKERSLNVYYFDKDIRSAEEDSSYRSRREEKMQTRLRAIRVRRAGTKSPKQLLNYAFCRVATGMDVGLFSDLTYNLTR